MFIKNLEYILLLLLLYREFPLLCMNYTECMNSLELLSVRMSGVGGVGMNIRLDPGQAAGPGQLRKSQEDLHLFQTTRV